MTEQNPPVVRIPLSENSIGAVAYITFVPAIVFLFLEPYCKSSFVRFHAWQSIFLNIAAIVFSLVLSVVAVMTLFLAPILFVAFNRLVWTCWVLIWILCAVNAINGRRFKLPIIGALAERQAGN